MTATRTAPLPYIDRFAAVAPSLPGHDLPWLRALRADAASRVARIGLPTTRVERWKYTNLKDLLATDFAAPVPTPGNDDRAAAKPAATSPHDVVFVNGMLRRDMSKQAMLPAGVSLSGLRETLAQDPTYLSHHFASGTASEDDMLRAVNTAFMGDGYVLRIAAGAAPEKPIRIMFVTDAGSQVAFTAQPYNLIVAEPGSAATIIESYCGANESTSWTNAVTDIRVSPGATVRHCKVQDESMAAFHTAMIDVRVAADGCYESFALAIGARLARNEIRVALDGERARCLLLGGYLGRGRQHLDGTTEIVHAQPHTTSREIYKGVLDDQARGVFQGKIKVERAAQKSDGHQLSKTLLLSDRAEIDSKPELEIHADDVKCSHGATAGELDEDALFYLRARGIAAGDARRMLVEAFMADVVEQVGDAGARDVLANRVAAWLGVSTVARVAA